MGEFWCKQCFLSSSPKAGWPGLIAFVGNAVPTVKITLGTPFPGVPAGNDPRNGPNSISVLEPSTHVTRVTRRSPICQNLQLLNEPRTRL